MSEKHRKMSMRDRMAAFIRSRYPKAELDHFMEGEYMFYPYSGAPDPYVCIVNRNHTGFEILNY